jgi:hypothetical protein
MQKVLYQARQLICCHAHAVLVDKPELPTTGLDKVLPAWELSRLCVSMETSKIVRKNTCPDFCQRL